MTQSALTDFCDCVRLIQTEFSEMPGLHLSQQQGERLWNLDPTNAKIIFDALEASRFLKRTANEMYIRADLE